MNIYTNKNLKRYAGELLVKDFNENKDYTFTNTSYGGRGDVLGTIERKDYHRESRVQYILNRGNWNDETTKLIRYTRDEVYNTETMNYEKFENEEVIKKLYQVSRDSYEQAVYTDDQEYAKQASKTRASRCANHENSRVGSLDSRSVSLHPNTPLYDKLFTFAARKLSKPLKYGTEISLNIFTYNNRGRCDFSTNTKYFGKEIQTSVSAVYRGRSYTCDKSRIFVKISEKQFTK